MELWFTEKQTENVGITCKIINTIHREKTEFQDLAIIDTLQFGRMLVLDGMVMTTDKDEFVYHEMIAHVPMMTHPNPKKVLVVGGGDGGTIREVIKHPEVEEAVLCEIDRRVVECALEYLPVTACGLKDERVKILYADGIKHVEETPNYYDVIIVDSTEPIGPAAGLFAKDFYKAIFKSLKADGIFAAQTESPFFNGAIISKAFKDIADVFPITKLYSGSVPTYPSGLWTWTIGSKEYDPLNPPKDKELHFDTKYYTKGLHKAAFELPRFCANLLR